MALPLLQSKVFVPPTRPALVPRPHLLDRLNEGLYRKLTLISAPAGFGKTTLVSEWLAAPKGLPERRAAWLSLDERDSDPARFLAYLVAALQTIAPRIGEGLVGALQTPQPPPTELILTPLLNEITALPDKFILVLDDYHLIDAKPVDKALTFLLEHLPPQMHLVIATREDPQLPLARLRAQGQLTELRACDLRFAPSEAATFLNQVMGLDLSVEEIAALRTRTEGWIAGLQLAAISIQGYQDATRFIKSFTGSHHFVMDYLVEEVLQQQSEKVQTFLLRTSILDRLCGPLCDAVLLDPSASGQETLEYLDHANLFIVPLDNERCWYRYHQLFADLLRQRLHQSTVASTGGLSAGDEGRDPEGSLTEYHIRASQWYEDNGLEVEAFQQAAAANDVERAARLIEGKGMPLHFRGAIAPVLNWLASLPTTVLNANPILWTAYASVLLVTGQPAGAEQKLQAAEVALQGAAPDDKTLDIIGRIAAIRATLAASRRQVDTTIVQSRRALEYLHPDNHSFRTFSIWRLGYAYHLQGDRAAASRAYHEAISISQASGNRVTTILATIGLGSLQETDNQLHLAVQSYQRALQLIDDLSLPVASEAHLGLARICYEWNNIEAAQQHAQQSIQLARQLEDSDRVAACEVFLARLNLAQGDVDGAAAHLAEANQLVRRHNFVHRMAEVADAQVLTWLCQGNLAAAAHLAQTHELPISQARVYLAQGNPVAALAVLEPLRRQAEAKCWQDERLRVMVVQAVAHHAHDEQDKAVQLLGDALALAEPGGFIRLFADEGLRMAQLLSEATAYGLMPDYIGQLLVVFQVEEQKTKDLSSAPVAPPAQPLIEPLSQRELEILQLIAHGRSNLEIGERLFLALDTVKGHNRKIFDKLQVQRRTEAVARARALGLL
jgi:LuxR family maltose regulon positive regulatory protein